jgi:DNA-binding transcriptional LysR family regulator
LKQGVQEVEFLSNPEAGELLIGSGSAFAEGLVLAIIDRLSQRYSRVAYHLMPGTLLALCDQLRARRLAATRGFPTVVPDSMLTFPGSCGDCRSSFPPPVGR